MHLREAAHWKAAFVETSRTSSANGRGNPSAFDPPTIGPNEAAILARRFFERARASLDQQDVSAAGLDADERDDIVVGLQTQLATLEKWAHPDTQLWVEQANAKAMRWAGLPSEASASISPLLSEYLRRALIQLHSLELARLHGDYSGSLSDSFFAPTTPVAPASAVQPVANLTVASAIRRFRDEELELRPVTAKTVEKRRALLRHIEQFFGSDTPVTSVRRTDCTEFRATLSRLPPNFGKQITSRRTIRVIADANTSGSTLARETQNSYLRIADEFFGWMLKERLVADNPASEIVPLRRREPAETQRLPFNANELRAIFAAPLYTGCVDDQNGFAKPGPNIVKRSRYWVPLLALFTGMRMGEVLQLTPGHIRQSPNGTNFIVLTKDMQLKTDAAEREIPIHPELTRIGFLEWVEQREQEGVEYIFDDVVPSKHGYRSDTFTKRFASFLREIEIAANRRAKVSFHSFRHTFKDALSDAGASEEITDEVCGWSRTKRTGRRYGTGISADRLKPFVEQVSFGIDLSHLAHEREL